MTRGLRVVFMGTPDFAASALRALIGSHHEVIAVYSQPPRPKGRGQLVQKSAVHGVADEHGIPVFTPRNFKDAADIGDFKALGADIAVVAAYGLILPQEILDAPRHGCVNIHASLLPRWRGAAPIHRAILAGDAATGITIMQMEAGLDTGPMIATRTTPIAADTTTAILHDTLAAMGADMIVGVLDDLVRTGVLESTPQPSGGVTYADKIAKDEAHIDWTQSVATIDRAVRAFYPFPGAWTMQGGRRVKILAAVPAGSGNAPIGTVMDREGRVACGDGSALRLITVQPEGKKPMDIDSAFNGGYLQAGMVLA